MKSQKTILFITPYFPPQGGGLEIYAQQIAKELCKDPHKRIVVVTSGEQNGIDRIQKVDNLKVYRLSYRFKLSNSPFSLSWISKIRRILKVERPDLVNIHTPVPGIGDLVAMLSPRIPLVVTYHTGSMKKENILFDIPIWTYEHIWLPILLRHARYIICPSDFVRLDFLGKYMSKSTTISPGIDNSIFKPDITKKSPHPTIVFVAAFLTKATKFKGLHTVIKSFSTLITEFPTLKLIVVGDGDMRSNYESEIRRLGIQSSVSFLGSLNQEELIEVYQKAHIFALPSKLESFGSSILEAMSCGMPVVSTRVGGIPSLVDDGQTGYLIKPDHPSILTEKIRYLLVNPQISKNFGLAARKKAVSSYSWKISAAKYDQIIDSILYIKPTIAQIVAYYPPHIGGMEIVAQQISHELANQGYPVKVLTSNIGSQNYPDIEISPNLVIKRLRSIEFAHTPFMLTLPLHLLRLPSKTILHVHIAQAGLPEIAMIIAKIKRYPYIAHFHLDVGPSGVLGRVFLLYKKHILKYVLQAADHIIVFSEDQSKLIKSLYQIKDSQIVIIPNGVAADFFYDHYQVKQSELRLLYVGRLAVQKRVERLVEAVPLLKFPVTLKIVGDGEDREKLETITRNLKLDNVSFEGKKYGKDLQRYYRNADIFVISSDKEGMPLVVLEAMASSLPIVGSDVIGIHELVNNVGVLVDDPSARNFANALNHLNENKQELSKLSKLSYQTAQKYSWHNLVANLINYY